MCSVLTASSLSNLKGAYQFTVRLFSFLVLALVVTACEKYVENEEPKSGEGKRDVTFSVMDVENMPMQPTRAAVADVCNRLSLAIFDYKTGDKVMQVDQTNVDEDFGTFTVKLDQGAYHVAIIGYTASAPASMSSYDYISFASNVVSDVFSYYYAFTLGPENGVVKANLKRTTALVRLDITGDIPSDAYRLEVRICSASLMLNPKTGYGGLKHKMTLKQLFSPTKTQYDFYVFAMDTPQTLDSLVFTATTNQKKVIRRVAYAKSVDISPNMITLVKGDFFKTQVKSSITVNDQWSSVNEYAIPDEDETGQP